MDNTKPLTIPWSIIKKILFRFAFLFFVLYIFFNPNGVFPYFGVAFEYYITTFHKLIPWIGKHILHLSYDIYTFTNGSGDTTYDYAVLLFLTGMAVLGCLVWTIIDRRRKSYNALYYWLTVIVRYYLAFTMLNYGFGKIFKLQFPFPGPNVLLEAYGNSSPMRLAWAFFGYSEGYNYFTGFCEIISGALLLFRRTTRLGAIFSLAVAGNIMAVNYSFDVCVKLLSTIMVIMAIFLIMQDRKRQIDFFFRNRQTVPENMFVPRFRKKWGNISMVVFKYVILAFVLGAFIYGASSALKKYGENAVKPPLYGIYNVQTFIRNKDTLPPLITDTTRWRRLVVSSPGYCSIKLMNDSSKFYSFEPDTVTRKILVYDVSNMSKKSYLGYAFIGADSLLLNGKFFDDSVNITMKKYDLDNFLLKNRGFHFINERPFNR